jgi:two-component system, chemotaxis family, CheB/CheR fusion protein
VHGARPRLCAARLEVIDTGRGIDPAFKARLFDMFSQAESGTARHDGGLALTKRLVDLHGGTLEVHSPGKARRAALAAGR